jgi:hypothetical protein
MQKGLIKRILDTILRKDLEAENLQLKSKVASLQLDLEEKDKTISSLKTEYQRLKSQKDTLKEDELIYLFNQISTPLTQLNTMRVLHEKGQEIKTKDVFTLLKTIEQEFEKRGFEKIGVVGEEVKFDSAIHQSITNDLLEEGDNVKISFVGFKKDNKIIKKALVRK